MTTALRILTSNGALILYAIALCILAAIFFPDLPFDQGTP